MAEDELTKAVHNPDRAPDQLLADALELNTDEVEASPSVAVTTEAKEEKKFIFPVREFQDLSDELKGFSKSLPVESRAKFDSALEALDAELRQAQPDAEKVFKVFVHIKDKLQGVEARDIGGLNPGDGERLLSNSYKAARALETILESPGLKQQRGTREAAALQRILGKVEEEVQLIKNRARVAFGD